MRKSYYYKKGLIGLIILTFYQVTSCFQFKYIQTTFTSTVIEQVATYTFSINRQMTKDLADTNWKNELIPANSKVRISFPAQYEVSDLINFSCNNIMLDYYSVSSYTCNLDVNTLQVVIDGLFPNSANISFIDIELANVVNPSPSIITQPFVAYVGNDFSANDTRASVFFDPAELKSLKITFSNPFVNTTSDMVLTVEIKNYFPVGGHIELSFPPTLAWSRDISTNHLFPIDGILSCEGISSNVNGAINCLGQRSTRIVAFANLVNSPIPSGSILQFKLKNMFSPPTTQTTHPNDALLIRTYDESSNQIQYKQSVVLGLQAKKFTSLQIVPLSGQSNFIVNKNTGLNFTFVLEDTINYEDYFHMVFPASTVISYSTPSSTFRFSSANFNTSNSTLTFFQSVTNNPERIIGTSASIGFVSYKAPKSCRVQTIQFKVMKYGYEKMLGSATVHAEINSYLITGLSLNETKINAKTQLQVSFQLKDPLSSSGLILIQASQKLYINVAELAVECVSTLTTGAKLKSSPALNYYQYQEIIHSPTFNTSLDCSSLGGCLLISSLVDNTSLELQAQNITLKVKGLQNVEFVTDIDPLIIKTFYDAEFDSRVAEINQGSITSLRTTSGTLTISTIGFDNSTINFQKNKLSLTVTNQNPIPSTGIILLTIPSELFVELSVSSDFQLLLSVYINLVPVLTSATIPVTIQSSKFTLKLDLSTMTLGGLTAITSGSAILIVFQSLLAPSTKQPMSVTNWYVQSITSSLNVIDQFRPGNNSNFVYRTTYENSLQNLGLYRSSLLSSSITSLDSVANQNDCLKNAIVCGSYILSLSQQQPFQMYDSSSQNQNVVQIEIARNIDITMIFHAYVAIKSQLVYGDSSKFVIYKPAVDRSAFWIQTEFNIQSLTNTTNLLSIVLPYSSVLDSKSASISQTSYNRVQWPFPLHLNDLKSQLLLLVQNVRNPFSLTPFTMTLRTQRSIQSLNSYIYSSGTTDISKNSDLQDLLISGYDFTNKYFSQQSNLLVKVEIGNWNEVSETVELRNSVRNNVKYMILAIGKGFTFPNLTSIGFCWVEILTTRENASCTIEQISPDFTWTKKINSTGSADIINVLTNSKYLVVFTLSDTFSSVLQTASVSDSMTLTFGQLMNPEVAGETLSALLKSVSIFTLTQSEYLVHKSLLQIVFSTNCLSPCKECVFNTSLSAQISTKCKSCYPGLFLYNNTCLNICPSKTFASTKLSPDDNTTLMDTCVDCLPQCGSCTTNTSCTQCNSSSVYKYHFVNGVTNETDCMSACPINGYFQNSVTDPLINTTKFQCSVCKENCSMCTSDNDCYKCSGFLILSTNLCIQQCPQGTIQTLQDIVFKNTSVTNVSVCLDCGVRYNDSHCVYCTSTSCTACSSNYSLDYLVTKKCLSACSEGYYSTPKTLSSPQPNYTYSSCQPCSFSCKSCLTTATNCLSCKWIENVTTSQFYILGNSCYFASDCPVRFFPDSANRVCANCSVVIQGCLKCTTGTQCTDCNQTSGFYNFTNPTTNTSLCLTSTQIPRGYLLINGTIQKCAQFCTECSIGVNNCTDCVDGYYLFNLQTGIGTCVNQCPAKYYPINSKLCTPCPYPCENCHINPFNTTNILCSSCLSNSSLYYYQDQCILPSACPDITYPFTSTTTQERRCADCLNNCGSCQDDGTTCIDCKVGFYLLEERSCVEKESCPNGTVGVVHAESGKGDCENCAPTCQTCSPLPTTCTSCMASFYFNQQTSECVTSCPSPLIKNLSTMQCVQCISPCETCENTVTNCTSCVDGFYLYEGQCLSPNFCPLGSYPNPITNKCEPCPSSCSNCSFSNQTSATVICSQCIAPQVLYLGQCISECPSNKTYNVSGVCMNCEEAIVGCKVCQYIQVMSQPLSSSLSGSQSPSSSQTKNTVTITTSTPRSSTQQQQLGCTSCSDPYMYLDNTCVLTCPSSYLYRQSTQECITVEQNADSILSKSLSNSTIMPLPFTMISCIIMVACLLSKLQNQNSYFVGTIYSLMGVVETLSVGYLILRIVSNIGLKEKLEGYYEYVFVLFLVVVGWIYFTNLLAVVVQSCLLPNDKKFIKYTSRHSITFITVSIISTLISYKFKMIIATRLFDFSCFKCQLQQVQKFNLFNVFSFIGIGHEGLLLYVVGLILAKFKIQMGDQMFLTILDIGIVAALNAVLALAVSKKDDDFFYEKYEGLVIGKKIDAGEDQETINYPNNLASTSKASLSQYITQYKSTGLASNDNLMQEISQDDQFSLSISHDQSDQRKSTKSVNKGKNVFDSPQEGNEAYVDNKAKNIMDNNGRRKKSKHSSEDDEAMKSSTQLKGLDRTGYMTDAKVHNDFLDHNGDYGVDDNQNGELMTVNKSLDLNRSKKTLHTHMNFQKMNKSQVLSPTRGLNYQKGGVLTKNKDKDANVDSNVDENVGSNVDDYNDKKNPNRRNKGTQIYQIEEEERGERSQQKLKIQQMWQKQGNIPDQINEEQQDNLDSFNNNTTPSNQHNIMDDPTDNSNNYEFYPNPYKKPSIVDALQESQEKEFPGLVSSDDNRLDRGWEIQQQEEDNAQFNGEDEGNKWDGVKVGIYEAVHKDSPSNNQHNLNNHINQNSNTLNNLNLNNDEKEEQDIEKIEPPLQFRESRVMNQQKAVNEKGFDRKEDVKQDRKDGLAVGSAVLATMMGNSNSIPQNQANQQLSRQQQSQQHLHITEKYPQQQKLQQLQPQTPYQLQLQQKHLKQTQQEQLEQLLNQGNVVSVSSRPQVQSSPKAEVLQVGSRELPEEQQLKLSFNQSQANPQSNPQSKYNPNPSPNPSPNLSHNFKSNFNQLQLKQQLNQFDQFRQQKNPNNDSSHNSNHLDQHQNQDLDQHGDELLFCQDQGQEQLKQKTSPTNNLNYPNATHPHKQQNNQQQQLQQVQSSSQSQQQPQSQLPQSQLSYKPTQTLLFQQQPQAPEYSKGQQPFFNLNLNESNREKKQQKQQSQSPLQNKDLNPNINRAKPSEILNNHSNNHNYNNNHNHNKDHKEDFYTNTARKEPQTNHNLNNSGEESSQISTYRVHVNPNTRQKQQQQLQQQQKYHFQQKQPEQQRLSEENQQEQRKLQQEQSNNLPTRQNNPPYKPLNYHSLLTAPPPKPREKSHEDPLIGSKRRPPTSKPHRFPKGEQQLLSHLPVTQKSFISGKPSKSHYPFQNKHNNKQAQQKDDTQIQVSFYPLDRDSNRGDTSFQSYQTQYRSKNLSTKSRGQENNDNKNNKIDKRNDFPYEELYQHQFNTLKNDKGHTQPLKSVSLPRSRVQERQMYENNDELSRLVNRNANRTSAHKRLSLQRPQIPTTNHPNPLSNSRKSQGKPTRTNNNDKSNYNDKSLQKLDKLSSSGKSGKGQVVEYSTQYNQLDDYYRRSRRHQGHQQESNQQHDSRIRSSRSKSRERPLSKESQNKLRALEKIYLQKLQWKK